MKVLVVGLILSSALSASAQVTECQSALADSSALLAEHRQALSAADDLIADLDEALHHGETRYQALNDEFTHRRRRDSIRIGTDSVLLHRYRERLDNRAPGVTTVGIVGFLLGVLTRIF